MGQKVLRALSAIATSFLLVSCGGGGSDSSNSSSPTTPAATSASFKTCNSSQSVTNPSKPLNQVDAFGSYAISQEIWDPAVASSWSQCTNTTIDNKTGVSSSFTWNMVNSGYNVVSFPNILFGLHAGLTPSSSTPLLPTKISSLPNLVATGSIASQCAVAGCTYNTGFDIFTGKTAAGGPSWPSAELMIFTSYQQSSDVTTWPNIVGRVSIGGVQWLIRHLTPQHPATSGVADTYSGTFYYALTPVTNLNLNIKDFITDAVNRGYIDSSDYLSVIELGTEIINGSGSTTITNYQIQ